jgi:hypothetical protein
MEFVDQVVPQQGLDQIRAPVHLDLPARLLLEPGELAEDVLGDDDGVAPLRPAQGP